MCRRGQHGEYLRKVLVLGEAYDTYLTGIFLGHTVQLRTHIPQAVGVVSRIAHDKGLMSQDLPPSRQMGQSRGRSHTLDIGAAAYRQRRRFVQVVGRSRRRDDVVVLVVAQKVDADVILEVVAHALDNHTLTVAVDVVFLTAEHLLRIYHARLECCGILLEHVVILGIRLAQHHRHALLDDTGLLGGDLAQRVTQILRMFEPHVGHHAHQRRDDVRGIETASKTRLYDRYLDITLVEVVECHGRGHLEER